MKGKIEGRDLDVTETAWSVGCSVDGVQGVHGKARPSDSKAGGITVPPSRGATGASKVMRVPGLGMPLSVSGMVAVARHPRLWSTALRMARRVAPDHGYDTAAFFRFRNQTQMGGDGSGPPQAHDLLVFLEWARKWDRSAKGALN